MNKTCTRCVTIICLISPFKNANSPVAMKLNEKIFCGHTRIQRCCKTKAYYYTHMVQFVPVFYVFQTSSMTKEAIHILYWFVFLSVVFFAEEIHNNKTTHSNLNAMLPCANSTQDGTRNSWLIVPGPYLLAYVTQLTTYAIRNSRSGRLDTANDFLNMCDCLTVAPRGSYSARYLRLPDHRPLSSNKTA